MRDFTWNKITLSSHYSVFTFGNDQLATGDQNTIGLENEVVGVGSHQRQRKHDHVDGVLIQWRFTNVAGGNAVLNS